MNFLEKFKQIKTIYKIIIIIIVCILIAFLSFVMWYNNSMVLDKNNLEKKEVLIELGSTTSSIAKNLYENKIISSPLSFKIYTKLNNESKFMAGKYNLSPSMSIKEIVNILKSGVLENSDQITLTFLEGKNIRNYAKLISEKTNNKEDDVFSLLQDAQYINSIINEYWFLDKIILDKNIYYSLEGYLFPDTYIFKDKNVTVKEIFSKLLDKTKAVLDEYKQDIESKKLTVHEIITMASLVEMEGVSASDKSKISSVFYNRLEKNMSLGSDVTTYYAFKIDMGERDLYSKELNTYNPYNTRGPNMAGKLPIGPISSVSKASLEAAINPETTSFLYFVADKNGKVYFTNTYAEHVTKTNELKENGLWFDFE